MKLKDFLTLKVGSGIILSGNVYNPLINYDWSTTTTSGLRYLKDVGSTPTYNASMYFGRGAYLNGVDQSIEHNAISSSDSVAYSFCGKQIFTSNRYNLWTTDVGISYYLVLNTEYKKISYAFNSNYNYVLNLTKNSIKLYENGLLVINITTTDILYGGAKTIGSRGGSYYGASYLKDFYIFDRNLTEIEITQAYEQPEAFYAMAQADSNCMLNMPMCETDKYVRNMKSYSKGSELDNSFVAGNYTSTTGRIAQFNLGLVVKANKTYLVEIEYDDTANSILTGYNCYGEKGDGTYTTFNTTLKGIVNGTKGTAFYLIQMPSTYSGLTYGTAYAWITAKTGGATAYISVRSLKELSGIYPITNYTTSVRDNAKNLQYGLQTCKFVRDSLGVIQSASDYLECDGSGYADTGWIVDTTKDFTVEFTKYVDHRNDVSDWLSQGLGFYQKFSISTSKYNNGWIQVLVDNNMQQFGISTLQGTFISIVVVVSAGSNFKVYVNKVLNDTTSLINTVTDIQALKLGTRLSWNIDGAKIYFEKNPITKFKVHNKALTNEEIQAL